jgi:hypothetical protein
VQVAGDHCSYLTLSSDIVRIAACFCKDGVARLFSNSGDAPNPLLAAACLMGIPLTVLSLAGAIVYLMLEERFNRSLLLDLIAEPRAAVIELRGNG